MADHLSQLLLVTEPLAVLPRDFEWPQRRSIEMHDAFEEVDLAAQFDAWISAEREVVEGVASSLAAIEGALDGPTAVSGRKDPQMAERVLDRLTHPTPVDLVYGLDFVLDLRRSGDLLGRFSRVVAFLVSAGGEGWLDRENHGMGYHFHYVTLRDRARTNVLLTFDPLESSPPDSLYWEHHGDGSKTGEPSKWGLARCRAVYDAAKPSLSKPGKSEFKAPSKWAQILWSSPQPNTRLQPTAGAAKMSRRG